MSHNAPAEVVRIVHSAMARLGMMKLCNQCFSVFCTRLKASSVISLFSAEKIK